MGLAGGNGDGWRAALARSLPHHVRARSVHARKEELVISVRWIAAAAALVLAGSALAAGDATRGARVFQACAACHSLEPGRHMTGPSLAGLWGRKAGTEPGFHRFSEPLKRSGLIWREDVLDKWLANPEATVPGNLMQFQGLKDRQARADLIAFLYAASEGKAPAARQAPALPKLKKA
ncbi:MAG: c-type cytochrome, partial [Bradyrhizobium sp.]